MPTPMDPADLVAVYGDMPVARGRPAVRVNMVSSLDGAVAVDGRSGALGGPGDRAVFRTLRSLADVILVAAGTARVEGYGPAKLDDAQIAQRLGRGQEPLPRIAVVSRSLDLDWDSPLFREATARPIVVTTEDAPPEGIARAAEVAELVRAGRGGVDLAAALTAIGGVGARQVLCEGGPSLNGAMAAAGLVDELCLTISPLLAGGTSKRILDGQALASPAGMALRSLLEADGVLFARYGRA